MKRLLVTPLLALFFLGCQQEADLCAKLDEAWSQPLAGDALEGESPYLEALDHEDGLRVFYARGGGEVRIADIVDAARDSVLYDLNEGFGCE